MRIETDKMTLFRDMSACGDAVQYICFYESFQGNLTKFWSRGYAV